MAHVRRHALCGLAACCLADPELIASRCMADGVLGGLQDAAASVRLAAVELVRGLGATHAGPLRHCVLARLQDASLLVRRQAFKACAGWLEEPAAAGELLRRVRHEGQQVRQQVLPAVEKLIFAEARQQIWIRKLFY